MTIDEMISKKKEYGYSCEYIAQQSGVPFSTVQKIFSRLTTAPRRKTIEALWHVFDLADQRYAAKPYTVTGYIANEELEGENDISYACEDSPEYGLTDGTSALNKISFDNSCENDESAHTIQNNASRFEKYSKKVRIVKGIENGKTIDDYLALPEGARVELIDGVFYDMAAPSLPHQSFALDLREVFKSYIKSNKGNCIAVAAPVDVQLDCDDKTIVQPDVMIICDRSKITKPRIVGAPDLIVEVLSPSNAYYDMTTKLIKYKKAGVKEYWIVNLDNMSVLVYDFTKSDFPTEYAFEDEVPVGIWDGKCRINLMEIYDEISFMLE